MINSKYFESIREKKCFDRQQILQSFRDAGYKLSDSSFYKQLSLLIKNGELVRVGDGVYSFSSKNLMPYTHEYSSLAIDVASFMRDQYPLVDFSIMELTQLNDFLNHQIAHNVLFLSVESDVKEFVFDSLKERYFGKVLIDPNLETYNHYWSDGVIVINKLVTEAPKGNKISWHARLEKVLVDLIANHLFASSISESEYPTIYENAFSMYAIDESCLFRYAKRRAVDGKIKKLIREKTDITLKTER